MNSPPPPLTNGNASFTAPLENETFHMNEFFEVADLPFANGHPPPPQDDELVRQRQSPSPDISEGSGAIISIPLRQWIRGQSFSTNVSSVERLQQEQLPSFLQPERPSMHERKLSLIRKTTVAYAIAELVKSLNEDHMNSPAVDSIVAIDNFMVKVAGSVENTIEGVDMISPSASLCILSPFFLSDDVLETSEGNNATNNLDDALGEEIEGKFLDVEIQGMEDWNNNRGNSSRRSGEENENEPCHLFGVLLYELYSEMPPLLSEDSQHSSRGKESNQCEEPSSKKTISDMLSIREKHASSSDSSSNPATSGRANSNSSFPRSYIPLKELGFPVSISKLIDNLLQSNWGEFTPDDAIEQSLHATSEDFHLLLLDPHRFLFDRIPDSTEVTTLDIDHGKLYGREEEQTIITDAFCRVSVRGESEALFVKGFSGSGKSKLVESMMGYVEVAGGYVIKKKFDPVSYERPLSVVVSAFNDICIAMRDKLTPRELDAIIANLMEAFGSRLYTLCRLIPNVSTLSPALMNVVTTSGQDGQHQNTDMNLSNVHFTLQLFARAVSSREHPLVLFLDDIQWSDRDALNVMQRILCDIKGASTLFFIGSYRSNEVSAQTNPEHAVFQFMDALRSCNMKLTEVHLDSLDTKEVNNIISDALGILPRICEPLSQLVLRKTEGNPLFVIECLKSLVNRKLLQYSFRERRWIWDLDLIRADGIAVNVCELLTAKMISLPQSRVFALKTASSFGTTLGLDIIEALMVTSEKFSSLKDELLKAVEDGLMTKDSTSEFKFVHDKDFSEENENASSMENLKSLCKLVDKIRYPVREAAYGLIPEDERNNFHHVIGQTLLQHCTSQQDDDGEILDSMIFLIVDQLSHVTSQDPQNRIKNAELNHKAASKAMKSSNYNAAFFYSKAAASILSKGHWESMYDLSRATFLVLSYSAYAEGHTELAEETLDGIIDNGKILNDKLEAYYLKITLLMAREPKAAHDTGVNVLRMLKEVIPDSVNPIDLENKAEEIRAKLNRMGERDFMSMKLIDSEILFSLMKLYSQVSYVSYFVNPQMLKWCCCRLVELSLEYGLCKYSAFGLASYAAFLGGEGDSYKYGKMSLKLLERFEAPDQLPAVYQIFYSYIAVHIEPFQSIAAMSKRGSEIGLYTGDIQSALSNSVQYVQKSFFSGRNLDELKKECDYQFRLIDNHSHKMYRAYMCAWQETISLLIDRKDTDDFQRQDDVSKELSESLNIHDVIQQFWLGRYDRCLYCVEKSPPLSADFGKAKLKSVMIRFYGGLSCFRSTKKYKYSKKLKKIANEALQVMREMREKSQWNYSCKVHLMEAEIHSINGQQDKARFSYDAAIKAARSSKFIHELGLAYEFAGLHYLKQNDHENAQNLLKEAHTCYSKWGSQVKVDHIISQLERISSKNHLIVSSLSS